MSKVLKILLIFLPLGLLIVGGYFWYLQKGSVDKTPPSQAASYKGEFACLPIKEGAVTEEGGCVYGLRDDSGEYYALLFKSGLSSQWQEGSSVEVRGDLDTELRSPYDVIGFINVSEVKKE